MQNFDFYSGKIARDFQPQFSREDPEYFGRLSDFPIKEDHKGIKKASSLLSLILTLCILSFTAGLIIGIKFVSGSNKELLDKQTKEAVTDIGHRVANLTKEIPDNKSDKTNEKKLYAKEEFPYIIKIGNQFNKSQSQEIAGIISNHGQTVILLKNEGNYKIYVGPYKNQEDAFESLKKIKTFSIKGNAEIIKR